MPNTAALATTTESGAPAGAPLPLAQIPFTRASWEHAEAANLDWSRVIDGNQAQQQIDIPAYGHLRSPLLFVQATGGTGAAAVYKEDAPWSVIANVQLTDVSGRPIVNLSGFELYLANLFGGFAGHNDPTVSPTYTAPAVTGNFSFALRVPVEISRRDGLGSLPNQLANATYKLQITMAAKGSVYSTDPTTLPTVRIRSYAESWTPVAAMDAAGHGQEIEPPDRGTVMFHSARNEAVAAGAQNVDLKRKGSLYRKLIMTLRTSTARTNADWPSVLEFWYENQPIFELPIELVRHYMYERHGYATLPTGVIVLGFDHDLMGRSGDGMRDLLLPVGSGSRLDVRGTFGASASQLNIVTVDIHTDSNIWD